MSGPEVAVVFPRFTGAGASSGSAGTCSSYLGPRHDTVFVGTSAPEGLPEGVRMVPVAGHPDPGPAGMWVAPGPDRQGAGAAGATDHRDHGVGGAAGRRPVGAERAPGVAGGGPDHPDGQVQVPARVRFAMPRHRTLLAMESQYFRRGHPRHILCTSRREVDDLARLYGVDPALTTVVPNPFDPERFNAGRRERDRAGARRRTRDRGRRAGHDVHRQRAPPQRDSARPSRPWPATATGG